MKWRLVFCLLLASTALARPRTKRSIGHLKSLIVNKLFGIGGKTIIVARPVLSNNETYQLFRIPGIDDFLVKVSKNDKKLDKDEDKPTQVIKDPIIVKPEVAIIGSYLGTTTQKETLLAIEMVKNLVRTGILTGRLDSSMRELLIPQGFGGYIEEGVLTQPMQVITEEEGHIFVPEYPVEFFVPPELKLANPNSKYYYKQKGPDADMTYESHDNKDVLVTRTEKQTLSLPISDAAEKNKNVGNSNTVPISQPLRINGPPAPYNVYQGMIAGHMPLPTQNKVPLYNVNQGIPGKIPENEQNPFPTLYANQGTMSGKAPGNGQISPPGFYQNQSMISGNLSGKGQNSPPGFFVNQGMISGNMPGQVQNLTPGYYVDQGVIPGQGKNPPAFYVNQGIATGGILGSIPVKAPGNGQISPPGFYHNQGMISGNLLEEDQNSQPGYFVNHGMISGNMPGQVQNLTPGYYVDQGVIPGQGKNPPAFYVNQGIATGGILGSMPVKAPGNGQISPPGFYHNQGMISGNLPGKGQNSQPGYFVNHGMISGNMPGQVQNPTPGYYVDQGIIPGQGKNPPAFYVNQGIATGGILGQAPYGAPDNVVSGMIGSAQGHVGNAPLMNNVNPNLMPGYFGPMYPPSVYYVNPGAVGGSSGKIPPYLSHGMGKPNIDEIGLQVIGNYGNGGTIVADQNPPLPMNAVVHPYYFGNNAQTVITCKEKQHEACPNDKTQKMTLNPTQNTNKSAVNQQNNNSTFGNAKKNVVKEFLKNHTVNGQIVAQYSYQQINSHSNRNYTKVNLSEPAAVETNKDLNKDYVYIPPGDSSIALSLKNEGQNGDNDKNAFTSKVNVRTNKEEIKRFMLSNRLRSNVRTNFKQNPIVVAEKRSNEIDENSTKPDDNSKGEIPGSAY